MNQIDKLTELFSKFPGIGPRQAKRFVYFLLLQNNGYVKELIETINSLKKEIILCASCFKLAASGLEKCNLCSDDSRDKTTLMIVAKDIDLENIERASEFNGYYFVLGGLLPILEKNPEQRVRIKELQSRLQSNSSEHNQSGIKEIILALSVNPEGDNTADYLKLKLEPICKAKQIKMSLLGRGLSTGTELEYLDSDTIKNALRNRQ